VRCVALCIVVGLHSLILLFIWKTRDSLNSRTGPEDEFIVWIRVTEPVPPDEATPSPSDEPVARADREQREPAARDEQDVTATPSAPRQIDWGAHAAFNAKRAVEESLPERYRYFGPRRPSPEPEPEPPSVFEEERKVHGEIGEDALGNPVVKLNKYCYQELEKNVPTAHDYGQPPQPKMTKCLFPIGKREPRGDLFEHLKKDRPLPELKEGTESELPERVEGPGSAQREESVRHP
jgi:hypothetical protein